MILITFILIFFAQSTTGWDEQIALAENAFQRGDYEATIATYETLIQSGLHDPALYFNLANAYLEIDDLGNALANFQRAAVSWPRDREINRYISQIRVARTDFVVEEPDFWDQISNATNFLTLPELSFITAFCWAIWFVLLAVYFSKIGNSYRRLIQQGLIVGGLITGLCLLLLASRWYLNNTRQPAVVTADQVTIRSGPDETYLPLFKLHSAAEIEIWRTDGAWVQFQLADGRPGWVEQSAVALIQES